MLSRIIVTGKNRNFPNTIRLPFGVGVDGTPATMTVQVRADQCLCKRCGGTGELISRPINPSERDYSTPCPDCDEGIATMAVA
jgi:Zn finger protein HypA/HybF involved in hydrogenase expression